ncbi:hypothetical protein M3E05_11615, partial [Dietzia cinnamea]|nr:hypothetical protein [Dietzia cinnamea]
MAAYTVTLAAAAFRRLTLIGFWTAVIAVVAGLAVPLLLAVQNIGWPWGGGGGGGGGPGGGGG